MSLRNNPVCQRPFWWPSQLMWQNFFIFQILCCFTYEREGDYSHDAKKLWGYLHVYTSGSTQKRIGWQHPTNSKLKTHSKLDCIYTTTMCLCICLWNTDSSCDFWIKNLSVSWLLLGENVLPPWIWYCIGTSSAFCIQVTSGSSGLCATSLWNPSKIQFR